VVELQLQHRLLVRHLEFARLLDSVAALGEPFNLQVQIG
jgi:hypothetical protein